MSYSGILEINFSLCFESPFITKVVRLGVNFAASSFQFKESELGHTTKVGFLSAFGVFSTYDIITDKSWIVFPRPMSSAKMPPKLYSSSVFNQSYPTCWYSLKSAFIPFGILYFSDICLLYTSSINCLYFSLCFTTILSFFLNILSK